MKRHRKLKIFGITLGIVLLLAFIGGYAFVQYRMWQIHHDEGAVSEPSMPASIENSADNDGRFTAHAAYTSVAAPEGVTVETDFVWDDNWFFSDPTEYNHELATACSVLSAIANSESEYYQKGSKAQPYVEECMAQLGFEKASTASYKYRSEVEDEIVNIFDDGTDVTAYSISSKHITDPETGETKLLLVTSVRGSYGSEWLSNLKIGFTGSILEEMGLNEGDHPGFSDAATEVADAVFTYMDNLDEEVDYKDVVLLFTGHSRGAATANMAAAYIDEVAQEWSAAQSENSDLTMDWIESNHVFAYTFATPELTSNSECRDDTYQNIFNILNPADIVPRMPLAAWGYDRYGIDYWLPEPGTDNFDEKYEQFKVLFESAMSCASKYDPDDAQNVDKLIADLSAEVPTIKDFESAGGVFKTLKSLLSDTDAIRVIQAHVPNVYIAWMQNIQPSELRTSR